MSKVFVLHIEYSKYQMMKKLHKTIYKKKIIQFDVNAQLHA